MLIRFYLRGCLATMILMVVVNSASAVSYTFGQWAADQGYVPGEAMPENVQAGFSEITSLDGIGDFNWNATPTDYLYLSGNPISSIETGAFSGLTDLYYLELDDTDITSIESGDFDGLTNLDCLSLCYNAITSIEPGDFNGMANLRRLGLHGTAIASLESGDFSGLANLQYLGLNYTAITSIDSGDFDGLTNLLRLDLTGASLTSIGSGAFSNMANLTDLNLEDTNITELNFAEAELTNLSGLYVDSSEIDSLIFDQATLTEYSLGTICSGVNEITEASLIGTNLTDTTSLNALLYLNDLALLTIDADLYGTWQSDLDTWDAESGHTLVVVDVPEPASLSLLLVGGLMLLWRRRQTRNTN